MTSMSPVGDFVSEVQLMLGCPTSVEQFGMGIPPASAWGSGSLDRREFYIVANGGHYIVRVGLSWPRFPDVTGISYAPLGRQLREDALLPGGRTVAPTGDEDFDRIYLIVGDSAREVANSLTRVAREELLGAQDLALSISGQALAFHSMSMSRWPHLESTPCLRAPATGERPRIGTEPFTPAQCAKNIRRLGALAARLEECQPDLWRFGD